MTEETITRVSVGVIFSVVTGIVVVTSYAVSISNAEVRDSVRLDKQKERQDRFEEAVDRISTDIATIKAHEEAVVYRLDSIDKKLDK